MNRSLQALIATMGAMQPKETAKERRLRKDRRYKSYAPPRSMTPAEKDYYDQHKTLAGFYA